MEVDMNIDFVNVNTPDFDPEKYIKMGSVEFSKFLINEARVAVSPGLGFREYGDEYVRFALIENKMRINQAVRGIRKIL